MKFKRIGMTERGYKFFRLFAVASSTTKKENEVLPRKMMRPRRISKAPRRNGRFCARPRGRHVASRRREAARASAVGACARRGGYARRENSPRSSRETRYYRDEKKKSATTDFRVRDDRRVAVYARNLVHDGDAFSTVVLEPSTASFRMGARISGNARYHYAARCARRKRAIEREG